MVKRKCEWKHAEEAKKLFESMVEDWNRRADNGKAENHS